MNNLRRAFVVVVLSTLCGVLAAQQTGQSINSDIGEIAVTTAVPFLRIAPDAKAGGMADLGIATAPDANSTYHNPAKLAFLKYYDTRKDEYYDSKIFGVSFSYTPWLRSLVNDIYLAHASAYYKIDKMQTVGFSLRYFSLGNITFTNAQGAETGQFRPNEFSLDGSYARVLAKGFSTGIALRFIYSNLATGQTVSGANISPGVAAAADIAFYYDLPIDVKDKKTNLSFGLNLSNLGSKISYTDAAQKDFIPMNMGFGTQYSFNFDDHNQLNIALDINKLLVPTPSVEDKDSNGVADYREKSVPAAIFTSFSDAPGGAREEFKEFTIATGIEYWYNQQFAVRAGYFYEPATKGNRRYFSAGLGLRYSVFGLDFSYLIPTSSQRNPLDNTLRFTLVFNFNAVKEAGATAPSEGI